MDQDFLQLSWQSFNNIFNSLSKALVFTVLLWGRHQLGWRGGTAIRWTLSGFALLLLGFYGSKVALEYIFA